MAAMKRRGARRNREQREVTESGRHNASAAQQDLAEAERRAKAAKTPIAKKVTQQVVDKKRRVYSGQAAREVSTPVPPPASGRPTAGAKPRRTTARRGA
jgi:hypothetical protein